jgi:hypothetical protein
LLSFTQEKTMSDTHTALSMMAAAPAIRRKNDQPDSWLKAMSDAWGKTLNAKAEEIEATSARISGGDDKPGTIAELSTQAMQLSFLSNSAHTATATTSEALKSLASKS